MGLVVEARYDAIADFYAEGWRDSSDDPSPGRYAVSFRDVGDEPDAVFR
jgi:hypothetical protein